MTTLSLNNLVDVKIGNAGELTVECGKFNDEVALHIFKYGLKQILNDTRSAEKDGDKAMALVEKKLAALYAGTLRASGERETDPVKAEARKIATGKVDARLKERKIKKTDLPEGKYAALVKELAAREDIIALAKVNVESVKALDLDDDILGEL